MLVGVLKWRDDHGFVVCPYCMVTVAPAGVVSGGSVMRCEACGRRFLAPPDRVESFAETVLQQ